jgi:hypothetical protein
MVNEFVALPIKLVIKKNLPDALKIVKKQFN